MAATTVTLTTGISAPLLGTINIVATTIDQSASSVTLQWDITNHTSGNSTMTAECDLSLDGGVTWNSLCTAARDQGYPLTNKNSNLASVTCAIPGVGNTLRMLRGSLTSTASVSTSLQLVIS